MKRAIATITVYVHGEDEKEMFDNAQRLAQALNQIEDCQAEVEELHEKPFGALEVTPIDISKFKV